MQVNHQPGPQKPIFGRYLGRAPNMARGWSVVSVSFGQAGFSPRRSAAFSHRSLCYYLRAALTFSASAAMPTAPTMTLSPMT